MLEAKISKFQFILTVITAAVLSVLFLIICAIVSAMVKNSWIFLYLPFFVIIMIICCVVNLLKYKSIKLIIGEKTVKGKYGFLTTHELDSPIDMISGVQIIQTLGGKIFNYGTIVISTASTVFNFDLIESPHEFKEFLLERMNNKK